MEHTDKPKWLIEIQNNSWEPELFISAGVVFTLVQIPKFLHNQSIIMTQESGFIESQIIANFLVMAVNGLTVGFIVHLITRGFWIGMVCMSYVFPNGINEEKLPKASVFRKKLDKMPDFTEYVIRLETASSIVFALSFVFFLNIIGTLLTVFIIIPHSSLEETIGKQFYTIVRYISGVGLAFAFIYLLDFLTLSKLKNLKGFSKVYYPIYRIFSILTLSFLYKPAYYLFITNAKPWVIFISIFSYLFVATSLTVLTHPHVIGKTDKETLFQSEDNRVFLQVNDGRYIFNQNHYENLRNKDELVLRACIHSDVIQENFLKIFMVHYKVLEQFIQDKCPNHAKLSTKDKLACLSDFYQLRLDGVPYTNVSWKFYTHPATGESGIYGVVPLSELVGGEHRISIQLNIDMNEQNKKRFKTKRGLRPFKGLEYVSIPFWVE